MIGVAGELARRDEPGPPLLNDSTRAQRVNSSKDAGAPGHLPQDIGPDPDAADIGRACGCWRAASGQALSRKGCCAAAPTSSALRAGGLRPTGGPGIERFLPDPGPRGATGWSCVTATRASTEAFDVDRVVLDLPEPWRVVPTPRAPALRRADPGLHPERHPGDATADRPRRVALLRRDHHDRVLQRGLVRRGQAVRPDHRMVAHTGFLTVARLGT